jgi:hypothetical protein
MVGNAPLKTDNPQALRSLMVAMTALAVMMALYSYGQLRISQAQEKASTDALSEVARILELRGGDGQQAIYSQLRQVVEERDEARKMRVARMAGIQVDWTNIFSRVDQLSPQDQDMVRRAIAQEFRLPMQMSLRDMKQIMHRIRPVPQPMQSPQPG